MEIGEPKKLHTDVPQPEELPLLEPVPEQPAKPIEEPEEVPADA